MTHPNPEPKQTEIHLNDELLNNSIVHKNVGQEFVVITIDKVKLCLREHKEVLESRIEWVAPLGVFLALLASLVAADFKDFFGLKKGDWRSLFVVGTIASLIWLFRSFYRVCKFWNKADENSFIQSLKSNSSTVEPQKKQSKLKPLLAILAILILGLSVYFLFFFHGGLASAPSSLPSIPSVNLNSTTNSP